MLALVIYLPGHWFTQWLATVGGNEYENQLGMYFGFWVLVVGELALGVGAAVGYASGSYAVRRATLHNQS